MQGTGPGATPTSGTARPGDQVILAADGGTMPVVVDGIAQVARYPGVAPGGAGNVFLEAMLRFGPGSGTFGFDRAEWVVVGPDGAALTPLGYPDPGEVPSGWPSFLGSPDGTSNIPPDWPWIPAFVVKAPASGRVTLDYRPPGGHALVTLVLRDE